MGDTNELEYNKFYEVFNLYLQQEFESDENRNVEVIKSLMAHISKKRENKEKLEDITRINFLGEYIETYFAFYDLDYSVVSKEIHIEESILHQLRNNKIKIFDKYLSPWLN